MNLQELIDANLSSEKHLDYRSAKPMAILESVSSKLKCDLLSCTSCNKMLGIVNGYFRIIVPILSANCRIDKILFTIKCPRCSEMNQIEFNK